MKLKLETPPTHLSIGTAAEVTLLVVTEGIELSHLAILKAGLNKLIASGKRNILLDCRTLQESDIKDAAIFGQISELRAWAVGVEGGAQVLVVSPLEKLGHVPTLEDGMVLITSGAAPLLSLEAKLHSDIKVLQVRKAELEAKITQTESTGDPKALLKQNSDLKKSIANAEHLTQRFLKNRSKDPFQIPATEIAQEALDQLLGTALKKEGILT